MPSSSTQCLFSNVPLMFVFLINSFIHFVVLSWRLNAQQFRFKNIALRTQNVSYQRYTRALLNSSNPFVICLVCLSRCCLFELCLALSLHWDMAWLQFWSYLLSVSGQHEDAVLRCDSSWCAWICAGSFAIPLSAARRYSVYFDTDFAGPLYCTAQLSQVSKASIPNMIDILL